MQSLRSIESKLSKIKPSLSSRYPIAKLAIFGSVARNENTASSDIDILVEFNKPIGILFFDLAKELEKHLNMHVDLVSKNGIKPAYFKEIESDLIYV